MKGDVVDDYHGTPVPDPYRWLEDSEAEDVRAWIDAENRLTKAYLGQIDERERIRARMTELWDYERYSIPYEEGGRYFWSHNDGLQNQSVVYVADSPEAEGRVLLDPNTLSEDGTVALSGTWVSEDGRYLAYGVSDAGSDWKTIQVMEIETGDVLDDKIEWVKFSGASWTHDGKGFFYSRFDEPTDEGLESINYYQKLFYHRIGTDQSEDELVFHNPDEKRWGFYAGITEDGRYAVIYNWEGTDRNNRIFYKDLAKGGEVVPFLMDFDASYAVIGNDGTRWYIETDKDAPKKMVVAYDLERPAKKPEILIPESEDPLRGCSMLNEQFVCSYLHDVKTQVKVFDLKGKPVRDVELPGIGSAWGFGGDREDTETFYSFTSFTTPGTIYRYDMKSGESTLFRAPDVSMPEGEYVTTQVFYPSKDGTKIPMFITHRTGVELDGENPAFLSGYGGFDISITPYYSTVNRVWLEMGGVLAIANLRGGGEYGADWHDAGRLKNKQNVFDDFHAAAEYLIAEGYTTTDHLGIGGRSNGGLLVGAAITQRPDLYGAALPGVGVLDMLRFHEFTIGHAWTSDYGDPDDPEMFPVLFAYSPYHNVEDGKEYPPTLITTGDHDDRVVPGHSFKFAARMQEAQAGGDPVLIRIETRAGHGAGKPTELQIAEWTDQWAFLVKNLGVILPEEF
ncbi:MAG TPA: prolyl oligopeptidase family serine peptidase [Myxococcota bacterium]|nr:prolyl oligopeptidase family serine peptidase [Myxococcota bacterium]